MSRRRQRGAGRGIVSPRGSRAGGQRASPHRRADRGALPGDGPRDGLSVRARAADDGDRDAPRRQAGRRPTDAPRETYYACLLSHAGCTTEAHVAAEVFGGSLTTSFNPLMYGSAREVLTGLLRALPDPGSPALVRTLQTARRLPEDGSRNASRPQRGLRGRGDAGRSGRRSPFRAGPPRPPDRALGRHRARCAGPRARRSRCRCGSSTSRRTPPSSAFSAAQSTPRASCASAPGTPSTRRWPPVSSTRLRRSSRSRTSASAWDEVLASEPAPPLVLEAEALDRALAAMGELRRPDLAVPRRPLRRRRRARRARRHGAAGSTRRA